jgi:hypothetical protein
MTLPETTLVVLILLALILVYDEPMHHSDLISECEARLPRTQRCVLIAVPELEVREQSE